MMKPIDNQQPRIRLPYSVEFKRTAYVSVHVLAATPAQAERLAWEQIENGDYNHLGFWELESVNIDDPYQP